jgi:two-component system sensor histidine kinase RpfC
MTNSHGAGREATPAPTHRRAAVLAIALAGYAIGVPLAVSALLAAYLPPNLPSFASTAALGAVMIGPCLAALVIALRGAAPVTRELSHFADDEPRQIIARLFAHGLLFAYVAALAVLGLPAGNLAGLFAISLLGVLCGWLLFAHLLLQTEASRPRRAAALITDIAFISLYLHLGGALAAPLFPLYIVLAAGFAHPGGGRAIIAGTLLSLAAFAAVFVSTPFWREQPMLAAGVFVGILLLPACTWHLFRQLGAARAEREAAQGAMARLLAALSHEVRTPLNSMIGTGSLLSRTNLDSDQRELLGALQQGARTTLGLINDILDLAKLESGKMRPESENFVLHDVLGGAMTALRPQADAVGVALALRVDPRLPHTYRGFPLQLRQLLVSIVGGLLKARSSGRIELAAALLSSDGATIRLGLTIRDDGDEAPLAMPALAGEHSQSVAVAIARELTRLMAGTLAITPEPRGGVLVRLELPLAIDASGTRRSPDLGGRMLILVSSDPHFAGPLHDRLTAWHGSVIVLADGEEALRRLATAAESLRPVLLVDGRDDPLAGLSLAHRLARAQPRPPMVIFIAAPGGTAAVAGLGAAHFTAVLEAPLDEASLASALLAALAGETRRAAPALPAAEPRGAAAEAPAEPPPAPAPARRLKILVAEDNSANRKILRRILETAGHEAVVVNDGEAALAMLDRDRFDLVLLAINMPEMSGYEVAKLYRMEHLGEGRLPIVALATEATGDTERQCREAGIDAVLMKPVEAAQLLAAIDETYARVVSPGGGALASPVVTPISAHPRYFADAGAVVDEATIEALRMLGGGSDFLGDVIETFCSDGRRLLEHLRQAVAEGDLRGFKELTHSLRSGAANVGAARLCQALSGLRDISAKDLRQHGGSYLEKLQAEFAKLETALSGMVRESRHG